MCFSFKKVCFNLFCIGYKLFQMLEEPHFFVLLSVLNLMLHVVVLWTFIVICLKSRCGLLSYFARL